MTTYRWSASEKKIARRVFDTALRQELAEIVAEFKSKAAEATTPDDLWDIRDFLNRAQRNIDTKYDYRYSQLDFLFVRLLREKRITEQDLAGLSEARLEYIRRVLSL